MLFIALGVWWNANTIAHHFIHRPFFRHRLANHLFAALLSVLLGSPASSRETEMLDLWMQGMRAAPPVKQLNGGDPEAFEIFRRIRERPLAASVLLPEGSREDARELLDFHRGVAAALFTARW